MCDTLWLDDSVSDSLRLTLSLGERVRESEWEPERVTESLPDSVTESDSERDTVGCGVTERENEWLCESLLLRVRECVNVALSLEDLE